MQQRADRLLQNTRAKARRSNKRRGVCRRGLRTVGTTSGRRDGGREGLDMLADDIAIVFLAGAAQSLEDDYEQNHADAGAREGALGLDAPRAGDEAGVDSVPIPQHLEGR